MTRVSRRQHGQLSRPRKRPQRVVLGLAQLPASGVLCKGQAQNSGHWRNSLGSLTCNGTVGRRKNLHSLRSDHRAEDSPALSKRARDPSDGIRFLMLIFKGNP